MHIPFDNLKQEQKIYLASDFHLGAPNKTASLQREQKIVRWLSSIQKDAAGIILVGDLFDFWFEYRHVVPKGYLRFLGKLAELRDAGIPVIIFTGNHDLWMRDYLTEELDIPIYHEPTSLQMGQYHVHIAHGDGLGPGDRKYKFYKNIFRNSLAQWAFRWLHPDLGISLANRWSNHSRDNCNDPPFKGENERQFIYCQEVENHQHHDLYIMGHRHLPTEQQVNQRATFYNLGDWITYCTYLEVTNEQVILKKFED